MQSVELIGKIECRFACPAPPPPGFDPEKMVPCAADGCWPTTLVHTDAAAPFGFHDKGQPLHDPTRCSASRPASARDLAHQQSSASSGAALRLGSGGSGASPPVCSGSAPLRLSRSDSLVSPPVLGSGGSGASPPVLGSGGSGASPPVRSGSAPLRRGRSDSLVSPPVLGSGGSSGRGASLRFDSDGDVSDGDDSDSDDGDAEHPQYAVGTMRMVMNPGPHPWYMLLLLPIFDSGVHAPSVTVSGCRDEQFQWVTVMVPPGGVFIFHRGTGVWFTHQVVAAHGTIACWVVLDVDAQARDTTACVYCILRAHSRYTACPPLACALHVPCMCTACALHVHCMDHACALHACT